jgi:hypothetical protein
MQDIRFAVHPQKELSKFDQLEELYEKFHELGFITATYSSNRQECWRAYLKTIELKNKFLEMNQDKEKLLQEYGSAARRLGYVEAEMKRFVSDSEDYIARGREIHVLKTKLEELAKKLLN